jgi:hypothetical protein
MRSLDPPGVKNPVAQFFKILILQQFELSKNYLTLLFIKILLGAIFF